MKKNFLVALLIILLSVSESHSLPSKYQAEITGIKNQTELETCWSFAVLGACESNYLTQNFGTSHDINLSEQELINSVNQNFTIKTTSDTRPDAFNSSAILTRQPLVINNESFILRDIYFLSRNNPFTALDNDSRKNLIIQNGALYSSIYLDHSQINTYRQRKTYFNNSKGRSTNHDILIIGWDDDFPLFYFSPRPSQNGAWLVKDSWGEDKIFWLSYEQLISGGTAFILDKNNLNTRIYYHDELGYCSAAAYNWSANIFRINEDCEYLKAASFYTPFNNTSYELYIYEFGSVRPDSPVTGHLIASLNGECGLAGYHTVDLPEELSMWHGEYFSIVLKLGRKVMPVETIREKYSDNAIINHHESYFSLDGLKWLDGVNINSNACIKVFTVIKN